MVAGSNPASGAILFNHTETFCVMKKTSLLFDLDGTLIDGTRAILASFEAALQGSSYFDAQKICAMIGYPLEVMFENLGFRGEQIQNCLDKYRQHYEKVYLTQTTLLPSVKEALNLASSFADLAVVTTKGSFFSKSTLQHLGILNLFSVVVGKDDVSEAKPSPEPILKALKLLNKGKENAFMIGDTSLDIKAAFNAGISCVALSCGYESVESLKTHGVIIKENAYEAVSYIKSIC